MRPSSASGWRTDVSRGVTITACSVSSKPTTERSSGTERPRSRAACSAPIATLSLKPKIAVGGSGSESSCSCRLGAARDPPVGVDDELGVEQDARRRRARRGTRRAAPRSRTSPGAPAIAPIRRWPSASRCSVACFAPDACIAATHAIPSGGGSRGSTTTNGKPCRCSVSSSSADSSGSIRIAPSVVPRISRSSSETSRSCSCSVGASTIRMSLSYSASAAPLSIGPKYASATSGSVSPIIPVRPLESPRAPRFVEKPCSRTTCSTVSRVSRRDVRAVVEDARDGRDRDAGEVGDVANRRAAAERLGRVDVSVCAIWLTH